MNKYKVVKEFDDLKIGDNIVYNEDSKMFEVTRESKADDYYYSSKFQFNDCTMKYYLTHKIVEIVEDKKNDKLSEIKKLISQLKNTYNQRKEVIEKKYNNGKLPTCQKVEHDTVYFNLMKLLNKFESIVNE